MELYDLSISQLQELLQKGQISATELCQAHLARVDMVDTRVRAFLTRNDEAALAAAEKLDQSKTYGALAGIPCGLKDIFCTRGIRTTCASRMLENFVPFYESTASARLLAAKAIMIGKLNMDEFAMGSSTEQSAFFATTNPWDQDRVPGGSSGGSAAAVAAGEVVFALGTDTGGSIRQPAAFCGIVGMKPTYGRVSRWGVIAYASSLDQVGALTRNVADCALVMQFISGHDPLDSTSANLEVPDYAASLGQSIKGLRIAYPREYFGEGVESGVRDTVMEALQTFEKQGAIVEEVSLPFSRYALSSYYLVATAEASANLARYDGVRYGYRQAQADNVIDMYSESRSAGFGADVKRRIMLGTYALSSGYYDAYYLKALKVRRLISDDFTRILADYDLIVSPTAPTTAFRLGENTGDPMTLYMNDILTVPVNMAGLPGMSIPCGFVSGLPVGLQLIGRPFDESTLFKAAWVFEQNTEHHKARPDLGVK